MRNDERRQPKLTAHKDGLKSFWRNACSFAVEAADAKLSFEDALGQLETIVESMESGEVPLADLMVKFEEGTKLLKICEGRLKDAELKIEQLKKQKDGSVTFEKFEATRED
jgi:exodeoxyribonuclease VII small subunit